MGHHRRRRSCGRGTADVVDGQASQRKNGSIVLLDRDGTEKVRWNFLQRLAGEVDRPGLNAEGNDVAIETLELAHEGLVRA